MRSGEHGVGSDHRSAAQGRDELCRDRQAIVEEGGVHATLEPATRIRLFDALGDLALEALDDPERAERCWTRIAANGTPYVPAAGATLSPFADQALAPAGGDQPHNNMQPYLTLYFNIALQGVFPARP